MSIRKTNQIRTYTETASDGIKGWYYTEPLYAIEEVEWQRWV